MKIESEEIYDNPKRFCYWTRIKFFSDDNTKKSFVLACSSSEYLEDFYQIKSGERLKAEHFEDWKQKIIKKWQNIDASIFDQEIHYDIYANTPEGEANITDFLVNELKR